MASHYPNSEEGLFQDIITIKDKVFADNPDEPGLIVRFPDFFAMWEEMHPAPDREVWGHPQGHEGV